MIKEAVNQDRKHLYNHPSIQDKHHRVGGKRVWGKWPNHNPDHHSQKENLEIYPHRSWQSTQHPSQGVREGQEGIWNFHPHQTVTVPSPTPQCQQGPSTESELPSPAAMRNLSDVNRNQVGTLPPPSSNEAVTHTFSYQSGIKESQLKE